MRIIPFLALGVLGACSGDDPTDQVIPTVTDGNTDDSGNPTGNTGQSGDTGTKSKKKQTGVCAPLPRQKGTVVPATGNLFAEIANAKDGDVLLLEPGTYNLDRSVTLSRSITIRSTTNDAADVIIDGNYASGNLFNVAANNVTFAHVTVTESKVHTFALEPEKGQTITGFRLHGVRVLNSGAYGVYANAGQEDGDKWTWGAVDNSEIACTTFELEPTARNRLAVICETGAIDAAGVRDWVVRDSRAQGFWCEGATVPHAMRFWRGSRDLIITRNQLIDTPIGLVVGESQDAIGRVYPDVTCPKANGYPQTIDATVTNNIVSTNIAPPMQVGILAESSCNSRIIHNSIHSSVVKVGLSSVEHRYANTSGILANNLMSGTSRRFLDSKMQANSNFEEAPDTVWNFIGGEDYRLAPGSKGAIDEGSTLYLPIVPIDIDYGDRDNSPDIGADEFGSP